MDMREKDRKDKLSCSNVMCFNFSRMPSILETQVMHLINVSMQGICQETK